MWRCACRRACSIAIAARSAASWSRPRSWSEKCRGDERADVQHADHAPLDEQRHAQQRADALLAQDRVEDVRVVDVLDRHGSALGGDPPGEAAPDRDPHAGLDLLLDALRGLGHEVAGDLVEEQERGGVGPEDRGDALEQLLQQLVERERRECGIGDLLKLADGELRARAWVARSWPDHTLRAERRRPPARPEEEGGRDGGRRGEGATRRCCRDPGGWDAAARGRPGRAYGWGRGAHGSAFL